MPKATNTLPRAEKPCPTGRLPKAAPATMETLAATTFKAMPDAVAAIATGENWAADMHEKAECLHRAARAFHRRHRARVGQGAALDPLEAGPPDLHLIGAKDECLAGLPTSPPPVQEPAASGQCHWP
jgi:hypothetical protein